MHGQRSATAAQEQLKKSHTLSVTVGFNLYSSLRKCSKQSAATPAVPESSWCACLLLLLQRESSKRPLVTGRAARHTCWMKVSALMTPPVKRPMSTITSSSSPLLTGSASSRCDVSTSHT